MTPEREAQIDFTHGNSVAVTIVGQPYPHLLSRLILSHSGWRYAEVVAGETLSRGPPADGIRQTSAIRPAYRLVQDLLAAKRDLSLPRQLRRLDNYDFLFLDDLGYLS